MAAVIIRKKDILRLGHELLKEIYYFLHDENILTRFEEMKEVQKNFLKILDSNHITIFKKEGEIKFCIMLDEGKDIQGIYNTLRSINFSMKIDEDLYYKKMAFLDIYRVFEVSYAYLDDCF